MSYFYALVGDSETELVLANERRKLTIGDKLNVIGKIRVEAYSNVLGIEMLNKIRTKKRENMKLGTERRI
jgi:hypothetical protein